MGDAVGYEHLSESTKEIHRERARRREQRLTRAERAAQELALEEARGARYRPARFVGGPWGGRTEMVELGGDGRLPPVLMAVAREPIVTDFGSLAYTPGQHRYLLDAESVLGSEPQYLSRGDL